MDAREEDLRANIHGSPHQAVASVDGFHPRQRQFPC